LPLIRCGGKWSILNESPCSFFFLSVLQRGRGAGAVADPWLWGQLRALAEEPSPLGGKARSGLRHRLARYVTMMVVVMMLMMMMTTLVTMMILCC
jgi:hypothetical protein